MLEVFQGSVLCHGSGCAQHAKGSQVALLSRRSSRCSTEKYVQFQPWSSLEHPAGNIRQQEDQVVSSPQAPPQHASSQRNSL